MRSTNRVVGKTTPSHGVKYAASETMFLIIADGLVPFASCS